MAEEDYRQMVLHHLKHQSDQADEQTRTLRTIRGIAIFYVVITLLPIAFGLLALALGLFSSISLLGSLPR